MSKPELNKTYSSFSLNDTVNRAAQIRRDNDTIKTPKVTIYDIDFAIMDYLRTVVRPQIIENNSVIDVPAMYANGEKWEQIQSKGYMHDRSAKIMTPVIALRRSDITERDMLRLLAVNRNPIANFSDARAGGNNMVFENKFSKNNTYDRFSVTQGARPKRELYVAPLPEFVDVTYDLIVWTEYQEQLNSIIEHLMPLSGFAWGTTWKFPTTITNATFETVNAIGEDRIIRATLPLLTKGVLLAEHELRISNVQKQYSVKKISFGNETSVFNVNTNTPPPGGY
jgi:hypothetical protein